MASHRANKHWFRTVLSELMQERRMSCQKMAEVLDRPPDLIDSVLNGTHMPSIAFAEQLLHAVGHEIEVIARVKKP